MNLPGWELASGLVFSDSKMAALKSLFLNNSRSKGNRMINHVSIMHYRPLSRRLDRCDRVIQEESGDSVGGNV